MKNTQRGFSLVEIMVAIGLLGVLTAGVTTLVNNSNSQMSELQAKSHRTDMSSEIRNILSKPQACIQTFNGLRMTDIPTTVSSIKDSSGTAIYSVGSKDKSGMLRITEFQVINFKATTGSTGEGQFILRPNLKVHNAKELTLKPDSILIKVDYDASSVLTSCISMSAGDSDLWSVSLTDPDNIYYDRGFVGIGTKSPGVELDVVGEVSVDSSTEGATNYVNSGSGYSIPNTAVNIRQITLTANTTITLPNYSSTPTPKVYTLTVFLRQDGTGNRTVNFVGSLGQTIKWDSGDLPELSAAPGTVTIVQFTKPSTETVWYASKVWQEN